MSDERQAGQCDCGEYHDESNCPNVVREDDDRWQFVELMGECGE